MGWVIINICGEYLRSSRSPFMYVLQESYNSDQHPASRLRPRCYRYSEIVYYSADSCNITRCKSYRDVYADTYNRYINRNR